MSSRRRVGLPSWATLIAWIGTIGTLLGIIGFFLIDLPNILNPTEGLSEQNIVATLAALQDEKNQAQLQLTQIALANLEAANQSTQQALAQQQAEVQATVGAVQTQQAEFLSTQNAIAAVTSTALAQNDQATAVVVTAQAAETATAAAIAQIPPTETPLPTETPVPAPVVDYRAVTSANVAVGRDGFLEFSMETAEPIPNEPPNGLVYVWLLDTDHNPETGWQVHDIGVDVRVTARFDNGTWIGRVATVQPDGTLGEPLLFADISANGPRLTATLNPVEVGIPPGFEWVARAELDTEEYALFPQEGHLVFVQ